ncbi:MAG: VWA domain-containing protein [Clostridia bacterium]|nr:VWA domain-containing protein [Clostridia bacterium]
MSFLFPLGLLGLIGIPIIILIYILQSKYTEQTVNSTYIWTLSDKFLKRRNPLSGMAGIISLILQLLMVLVISLAIARPIFVLPGSAHNYCFVLDASSSMTTEENGTTRFDRAKGEIVNVMKKANDGSSFSLICVSDEAISVFDSVTSKKNAINLVDSARVTNTHATHSDLLQTAQEVFDNNTSTKIYFVTDKGYEKHDNIEIIDVGNENVENYGVFDVEYSHIGGTLTASANLVSYNSDSDITLSLLIDGERKSTITKSVKKGVPTKADISAGCESFSQFSVVVENKDGYSVDNEITTYNKKSDKSYSVLIVSETGFFFKAVIDALVDSEIKVIKPSQYETETEKYGLYIFDSYEPPVLPDGATWLINADESIENAGFGVRGKLEIPNGDTIDKSTSTSTNVRHLLRGVSNSDIYITNYVKYSGMYLSFHTLYSYDSNPLIFAGTNGTGNRQVVFGFDLHNSDFALTTDFVILMRNLLEYSFPDVIDKTNYIVGEDAIVNIVTNATNFKAQSPSGKDIYIETDGTTATIALNEVGTYTITMTVANKETSYKLYSCAHPNESTPAVNELDFSLAGEATYERIDGEYDPIVLLFVLLALLFIADWGVYLYDKYQLR